MGRLVLVQIHVQRDTMLYRGLLLVLFVQRDYISRIRDRQIVLPVRLASSQAMRQRFVPHVPRDRRPLE